MIRSFASIVVVILCMCACSGSHDNENYTGTLYFVWGQTLYAMNLQDRYVTPVYENPAMIMLSLQELDDQHLLLGYQTLAPEFGRDGQQIVNRLTGSVSPYGGGMQIESLRYLPQLKVIVFSGAVGADDHWSLYWANVDTPLQPHLIDDTATAGTVIAISGHQVIYTLGTLGGNFRIKMYDFKTHRSSPLKLAGCDPILWRSQTNQLVCNNEGNYYLVRLDGSGKEGIHLGIFNRGLSMVAYVKEYDSAIMTNYGGIWFSFRRGFYEDSDLYLYSFQTGKLTHISNRYAASGSPGAAVWYPDRDDFAKKNVTQAYKYQALAYKRKESADRL